LSLQVVRGKNDEDEKGNGGEDFARPAHGNTSRGDGSGSGYLHAALREHLSNDPIAEIQELRSIEQFCSKPLKLV